MLADRLISKMLCVPRVNGGYSFMRSAYIYLLASPDLSTVSLAYNLTLLAASFLSKRMQSEDNSTFCSEKGQHFSHVPLQSLLLPQKQI